MRVDGRPFKCHKRRRMSKEFKIVVCRSNDTVSSYGQEFQTNNPAPLKTLPKSVFRIKGKLKYKCSRQKTEGEAPTSVPTRIASGEMTPNNNTNHLRQNSSVIILRNLRAKDIIYFPFYVFLLVSIFRVPVSATEFSDETSHYIRERAEAAKKWAPLVFLHPEERFFPSAVHTFLKNVIPREVLPSQKPPDPPMLVSMSRSLDIHTLPEGPEGEDTYLIAPIDPDCKNCPLPRFLFGDKPSGAYTPPVYAVISSCLPSQRTFKRARNNHKSTSRAPSPRRKFRLRNSFPFGKREARSSPQYESSYGELSYTDKPRRPILKREAAVRHTDALNSLFDEDTVKHTSKGKLIPPSSTLLPPKSEFYFEEHITINTTAFPSLLNEEIPIDLQVEISIKDLENEGSVLLLIDSGNETEIEDHTEPLTEFETSFETSFEYLSYPNFTANQEQQNETTSDQDKTRVTRQPEILTEANYYHQNTYETESPRRKRGHRFTVTYWMFYPFSQGKEVCTSRLWILGRVFKPRLRSKCYGETVTLNSHVGDWEHVSIYFEDNLPQLMYVSTHTYGAFYNYNPEENIFIYRGKDTRVGIPLNPKYPEVVKMDGTHPVLYSSLGSHGLWAGPGVHRYENLVPLDDKTGAGVPWELWKNIDVIDNNEPEYNRPDRQWLNFHGRWGNPSSNCHRALFGTCDLASGPTGIPLKRPNFPCHLPDHPTFFPKL